MCGLGGARRPVPWTIHSQRTQSHCVPEQCSAHLEHQLSHRDSPNQCRHILGRCTAARLRKLGVNGHRCPLATAAAGKAVLRIKHNSLLFTHQNLPERRALAVVMQNILMILATRLKSGVQRRDALSQARQAALGTHWKTLGPNTVARFRAVMRFCSWRSATWDRKWHRYLSRP